MGRPRKAPPKEKKPDSTQAFKLMLEKGSDMERLVESLESDIEEHKQELIVKFRHWAREFMWVAEALESEDEDKVGSGLSHFGSYGPDFQTLQYVLTQFRESRKVHKRLMISLGLRQPKDDHDWYSER